jgi:hypothetical protein
MHCWDCPKNEAAAPRQHAAERGPFCLGPCVSVGEKASASSILSLVTWLCSDDVDPYFAGLESLLLYLLLL